LLGRLFIGLELQDPEHRFTTLFRNVGIPDDFKFLALKTDGTWSCEKSVTRSAVFCIITTLKASYPSVGHIHFICIHFKTWAGANYSILISFRLHNNNKTSERCSEFADDMQNWDTYRMNLRELCVDIHSCNDMQLLNKPL